MSTTRAILQPYLLAFFCIDREARQLAIEISLKVFFGTAKLQTVLFLNQYRAVKAEQHPTAWHDIGLHANVNACHT